MDIMIKYLLYSCIFLKNSVKSIILQIKINGWKLYLYNVCDEAISACHIQVSEWKVYPLIVWLIQLSKSFFLLF